MDLKVLGCHGGETPKHRTSSFLVDDRLAIDAGAVTSMLSLEEQRNVHSILVSHPHMDHIRDLATIADNRCQQQGPPLEIVGVPSTIATLKKHFFNDALWPDFSKIETEQGPTLVYRAIEPERPHEVGDHRVTPIPVSHTIETAGFLIENDEGAVAYSGDTGPTTRFWEHLNAVRNLKALLMEVSFPNDKHQLAHISGHHTPSTLGEELFKLEGHAELPILLYHIKPVFQQRVERELARIRDHNLTILQLGDQFLL
jgi:3',5'-cyclic-nucleotide phosphodiesterase